MDDTVELLLGLALGALSALFLPLILVVLTITAAVVLILTKKYITIAGSYILGNLITSVAIWVIATQISAVA